MSDPSHNVEWLLTEAIVLDDLQKVKEIVASHGLPSKSYEILQDAMKFGRNEIVKFLLEKGAQVNCKNSKKSLPLRHALRKGDTELVQMLLASGVAVDASEGYRLLRDAVKLNYTKIAMNLLEKGVSVNLHEETSDEDTSDEDTSDEDTSDEDSSDEDSSDEDTSDEDLIFKDTPLHFAVANENLLLVQRLLEHKAAIDAFNAENETPLHIAVEKDRKDIVSLLLIKGAGSLANNSTFEPLHVACIKKSVSMVALFVSARPPSEFLNSQSLFRALCLASQNNSKEIVSLLLSVGAHASVRSESDFDSSGSFPIHLACEGGHLGIVKLLLQCQEENINSVRLEDGFTPLCIASEKGHVEIVSHLLAKHADPNIVAEDGVTPLHLAVFKDNLKIVDLLCKNGANVNAVSGEGLTALLIAMQNNHVAVAKMLLFRGASVNVKDEEGHTPLYFSLRTENHSLCSYILQLKPDIDEELSERIIENYNYSYCNNPAIDYMIAYIITTKHRPVSCFPLDTAVAHGYLKTVEALIASGVNPKGKNFTPPLLHLAVQEEHSEITEMLLKAGCPVNGKDKKGKSPIQYLFDINCPPSRKSTGGKLPRFRGGRREPIGFRFDIFELLVANGADLKQLAYPLHRAAERDDIKICKYLVENGIAGVNDLEKRSKATPLFYSAESDTRRGEVLRYLLKNGADSNAKGEKGETPLHRAAKFRGRWNGAVQALLESGADPNAKNRDGEIPLHHAAADAYYGVPDSVEILLKNGAEVDVPRKTDGATPLHLAARTKHVKVVELLLEFHANIKAKDAEGHTPLQWALSDRWRKSEAVPVLLEHNCNVNILDSSGKGALRAFKQDLFGYFKDEARNAVLEHLLKLKFAKLFINKENELLICELLPNYAGDYEQFEQKCKDELEKMKELKLCCHLSLYDVLVDSSNPVFKIYDSVLRNLESVEFCEFPVYGKMIENMAKKNQVINASKNSLNLLIKIQNALHSKDLPNVPAEVLLKIVSYLGRNDLRCLTECGDALKHQLSELAVKRKTNATVPLRTRSRRKNIKKTNGTLKKLITLMQRKELGKNWKKNKSLMFKKSF